MEDYDWLIYQLKTLEPAVLQQLGYTLWYLWFNRNMELHGEGRSSSQQVARKIQTFIEEYNAINKKQLAATPRNSSIWRPPPLSLVKINFDVAYDNWTGVGGYDVIMRDHEGFVLAAKTMQAVNFSDSFVAEAQALLACCGICY